MITVCVNRFVAAVSTAPSRQDWLHAGALLLFSGLVLLLMGRKLGFLHATPVTTSWKRVAVVVAVTLVAPALTEELVFRVWLLPHPSEPTSATARWLWGCASVAAFVAYHPLKAVILSGGKRSTFTRPVFLLLTTLLGAACTTAYLQSGSLWPPVVIHWLIVAVWLLFFGGYERLYPDEQAVKVR